MAQIDLVSVSKEYSGTSEVAVRDVDLTIGDGEFFVLLGPSGCGKSTLLKLLAGLELPTAGEIYLDGEFVNYASPADRNVAMVFQSYALYPQMTVRENLSFPLKMAKVGKQNTRSAVEQVVEILGLEALLDRRIGQLSGGQRQRVAVGRAIVRQPRVMLMDEPLSNLDALRRLQTREELMRLHQSIKGTVVYVTHDQIEAMTMADRIGVMRDGQLIQIGTPQEIYRAPVNDFVGGFIGTPPLNFVAGDVSYEGHELRFRSDGVDVRLPAVGFDTAGSGVIDSVKLGVRPEAIEVDADASAGTWCVELVEMLGPECIVLLRSGRDVLRARIPVALGIDVGQQVTVTLTINDLHLFAADGRSLRLPRSESAVVAQRSVV